MGGVVRPVAESILPKAALSGKSGRPVATNTAYTAGSASTAYATNATDPSGSTSTAYAAHATDTPGSTSTAYAANATDTAGPTRAADASDTTDTAGPTSSANAADTANAAGSANTTNTTNAAHATDTARPTHTADASRHAIEVVVVVDIDTSTAPVATPTPTASPPRSHQYSGAERYRGARRIVAGWIVDRRIRILRRAVYSCRLIGRHIYNLRIGRLDHNHALIVNYARSHCLLFGTMQSTLFLRLSSHTLNGIHHFALLRKEGITQVRSPLKVIR